MPQLKRFEPAAFLLLFIALGYALVVLAPGSALSEFSKAETLACYAAIVFALALLALRALPARRLLVERFIYAAFLAGMPFVYLAAALIQNDSDGIVIEVVGVPVFVGLAAYGYFRSFAVLGVGIVAHGVGWDLWHHGSAVYIASWYPLACLLADLALGFLAITQMSAHQVPNNSFKRTGPDGPAA